MSDQNSLIVFEVALMNDSTGTLHTHSFYEILLCTSGRGRQCVADRAFEFTTDDVLFFPPGQPHFAHSLSSPSCLVSVIYLSRDLFQGNGAGDFECRVLLDALTESAKNGENRIRLNRSGVEQARKILQGMLDEEKAPRKGHFLAQKTFLQNILLTFIREAKLDPGAIAGIQSSTAENRIRDFCTYLDQHFDHDITVAQAMAMTHLGRSHFHSLFKRETGTTLMDYLNRKRCDETVRLLQEETMSLRNIADACGFRSLSHLRYILRKYANTTPGRVKSTPRDRSTCPGRS
jgi:AraC-like DNA-binding protein